jgi:hypothetical protein
MTGEEKISVPLPIYLNAARTVSFLSCLIRNIADEEKSLLLCLFD